MVADQDNLSKPLFRKVELSIEESQRIYDSNGFLLRAATVCVKDSSESEVLLISSSRHSDRWIIPGGKMESDEAPEFCAMREALEESGAEGDIGRCLGSFDNTDRGHRTRVYVLYVNRLTDEYQEKDVRKRKWVGLDEAQKLLGSNKPLQAKYILAMKQSKTSTTPDAGSGSSA